MFVLRFQKRGLRTRVIYNIFILNKIQRHHVRTPRVGVVRNSEAVNAGGGGNIRWCFPSGSRWSWAPHLQGQGLSPMCLGLYGCKIHISAKLACLRIAVDSHIYHDRPLGHHIGCHEPRLPYRNHQDFSLTGKLG